MRAGDGKAAVDVCVAHNAWDKAVELAETLKLPQIEGLLNQYAGKLLEGGRTVEAVELYRKARRETESAKLLAKLAGEVGAMHTHPLRAKKLFVMAALDVEKHKKRTLDLTGGGIGGAGERGGELLCARYFPSSISPPTHLDFFFSFRTPTPHTHTHTNVPYFTVGTVAATTLANLMRQDAADVTSYGTGLSSMVGASASAAAAAAATRTLDRAWHCAEGWHFLCTAQRLLYAGDEKAALTASMRLTEYEDCLEASRIYGLIALAAFYCKAYATASRAFVKLENLETLSMEEREGYAALALSIFSKERPIDPLDEGSGGNQVVCPARECKAVIPCWSTKCNSCALEFKPCVATGQPIFSTTPTGGGLTIVCKTCRHFMLAGEVKSRVSCPLCLSQLFDFQTSAAAPSL